MAKERTEDVTIFVSGRLMFERVYEPGKGENADAKPKYSAIVAFPKTDKQQIEAIKAAQVEAAKRKWGDKAPNFKADRKALRDGDQKISQDGSADERYEGMCYISGNSPVKPLRLTRRNQEDESDDLFYAGCYVRVKLGIYGFQPPPDKKSWVSRVTASLKAIQFVANGEPFSAVGRKDDGSGFGDMGDGEDEAPGGGKKTGGKAADSFDDDSF